MFEIPSLNTNVLNPAVMFEIQTLPESCIPSTQPSHRKSEHLSGLQIGGCLPSPWTLTDHPGTRIHRHLPGVEKQLQREIQEKTISGCKSGVGKVGKSVVGFQ